MSTLNKCLYSIDDDLDIDCSKIEKFITHWENKNGGAKLTRQALNFRQENYLKQEDFLPLIKVINGCTGLSEFDKCEAKLYTKYEDKKFKGGSVDFIRITKNIGTNVSHYSLERSLSRNNPRLFRNKPSRIEAFLKEICLDQRKPYHKNIDGRIKTGNTLWVTWSYQDEEEPFSFVKNLNGTEKKEEVINQLGLVRKYYISEPNYLIRMDCNKPKVIYRATICDAGNSNLFKVSSITNHGFTVSLKNQEIDANNDGSYGRPEGIIQTSEFDIKDRVKISII